MRLLIDTHVFVWSALGDPRLPRRLANTLSDRQNSLLLSVVSCWEIAIKVRLGKLHLPEPLASYLPSRISQLDIELLPITLAHTIETASLSLHRGDPFDRLLIAQSRVEDVPLVTSDLHFTRYPIKVIW